MWFSHSLLEVIWQLPSRDRPAPLCSERKRTQKSGPSAQIAYKLSPPKQGSHQKKGSDWPRRVGAKKLGDSLGGERTRPLGAWAVWSLGSSVKGYRGHIIYFSSEKILSPFSLSNILMHRQVNVCVIGARYGDCGATDPLSLQLSWQPCLYHTTPNTPGPMWSWRNSAHSCCSGSEAVLAVDPAEPWLFSPSLDSVEHPGIQPAPFSCCKSSLLLKL